MGTTTTTTTWATTTGQLATTTTLSLESLVDTSGLALDGSTKELQVIGIFNQQHDDDRSIDNLSAQNTFEFGAGLQTKGVDLSSLDSLDYDYERAWDNVQRCWNCNGVSAAECQKNPSNVVECPKDNQKTFACEIERRNNGNGQYALSSRCKEKDVCEQSMKANTRQCRQGKQGSRCVACCVGKKCYRKNQDITQYIYDLY